MVKQITITGKTTTGGAASTITLTNNPPIKSILAGELIKSIVAVEAGGTAGADAYIVKKSAVLAVSGTGTAYNPVSVTQSALTVVTVAPTANLQIQRTGDSTVSLYLTVALAATDIVVLTVEAQGEQVRP